MLLFEHFIFNYDKEIKYCSEKLNRSYYSVKSQYQNKKIIYSYLKNQK